ncbi:MAG: hypothetical protein U0V02_07050 [Anaerolineales bacterium]
MKKNIIIIFCLVVSLLVASCEGGQATEQPTAMQVTEAATATSAPEPSQEPTPTSELAATIPSINSVTKSQPVAYPKEIVAEDGASAAKLIVPSSVANAPEGTNVKLWLADPRSPEKPLVGGGVFLQPPGADWYFTPANDDGTIFLTLESGEYQIDSTEPNGLDGVMSRHRYVMTVSASGEATIADLEKNERGFFAITLDMPEEISPEAAAEMERLTALAEEPASTFVPTSACQMPDLVTQARSFNTDLSAGFPKVRVRLPSYGHIKAIIVPIDFPDVPGKDDPVSYFTPVANGVTDFYYQQSYGRLAFDFTIVPNWVHVPFTSTKYGTGGGVGAGDPEGYRTAVIALTDPQIDYSEFDAVYFLVPKEMPMANMGWGPAITFPNVTSNGVIINGATGGADMYEVERNGINGARWKWMAHETGHAFGLYDEDLNHESQSLGYWGIMAMSWSNEAIELGAWDRYLQGWLVEDQINCLEKDKISAEGETVTLAPLVRQDVTVKSVMIPLSDSKILVMESRRNEGLDTLPSSYEGLLVYTVDTSIGQLGGGYVIQPRTGFTDKSNFQDAALRIGDSITVDGITITVIDSNKDGDIVKIQLQ